MALALEDQVFAWQKVKATLETQRAGAYVTNAFRELKDHLVGKGVTLLQVLPFSDADIIADTGYSPIGVAATVYAFYVKKGATATDSWVRAYNMATNTTPSLAYISGTLLVAGDEFVAVYPKGLAFGTDVTISADTGAAAGTESTAGDAGNGFVLVGAA